MATRTNLAQRMALTALFSLAAAGCGNSHGPEADGGARDGGPDSTIDAAVDSAVADTGARVDAGGSSCEAADVASTLCPDVVCDEGPRWYWNGDSCFPIECGACTGSDCERAGDFEEATCLAAHGECEASLCRNTGGTWRWWSEECDHWQCGAPQPVACLVGRAVCDCGAFRSFDPASGCYDGPDCPLPEPVSDEALCLGSGGSWESICCPTECGEFCAAACAGDACNCGPGKVFEGARGCVESSRCFERGPGLTCDPQSRCGDGTLCCQRCGGAGCVGPATCEYPVCDADETIDMCGNNLLAP